MDSIHLVSEIQIQDVPPGRKCLFYSPGSQRGGVLKWTLDSENRGSNITKERTKLLKCAKTVGTHLYCPALYRKNLFQGTIRLENQMYIPLSYT